VPADSPLWGAIERANAERIFSLVIEPREIHSLPYLGVANIGHSLRDEADVETLRSLNKHRSWLERRCQPLSIEVLQDSAEIADAFDSLVRFLYLRWQNHPRGSSLSDRRAVRFHHHVLPRLADEGRLRMIRLADCGRTIAVFYGLQAGRWWGYYLCGYDRKWAGRIRLGMIAIASAIDLASADGGVEFDFLKGAERVKYQWPVRTRVTLDADVYSVGSGPQARRATRAARDAVAAMTKSARHLFRSAQLIL
jgi:CelD/BcsL family acetyltransferase involved in cellulose biosynthesis